MNLLNAAADWAFPDQAREQREREEEARRRRERQARAAAARRPSAPSFPAVSPMGMAMGMAVGMPMQQARHMAGMHGDVMSAIEKENYSRVSQIREMRRLQHEKDKERERMQHERDMLLMRLQAMRGE